MVTRVDMAVDSAADFAVLRRRFRELPARPKVLRTREAGLDISSPGRQSLSLLIGEETAGVLYSTDVYLSPGFGAPPHHQPTEEELWYLLEGELDVRVGMQSATIRAGAFAFIPRDTTHTFRNNGKGLARLLTWNTPAGHERAFEAMRRKAEQGITAFPELREVFKAHEIVLHADPDQKARNDASGGKLLLERTQGRDASRPGADVRVLLDAKASGGLFEVSDVLLERERVLSARSDHACTCLYVVKGEADLSIDSDRQRIGTGAFAFIPRGHSISIAGAGESPTHFILWTTSSVPTTSGPAAT